MNYLINLSVLQSELSLFWIEEFTSWKYTSSCTFTDFKYSLYTQLNLLYNRSLFPIKPTFDNIDYNNIYYSL